MLTNKNKILAYILTIILLLVASLLYFEADMKGFPDGHLTELDRAEQFLFYISSVLSLLTGLFLLYLARFKKKDNYARILHLILIFLFLTVLILGSFECYFISNLDDGIGG